jgi:hypothetical protein
MVNFMEDKKITKMTPEDVKEFEGGELKETAAAPQQESIERAVNEALRKFRKGK